MLAKTELAIERNVQHRRLISVKLAAGTVNAKLEALPKGVSVQVETPVAVCAAVGTDFSTMYAQKDDGAETVSAETKEGTIRFSGATVSETKGISGGGKISATILGGGMARFATVDIEGQDMSLVIGDEHVIDKVSAGSRQEVATFPDSEFDQMILKVAKGTVVIGDQVLDPDSPPVFVREGRAVRSACAKSGLRLAQLEATLSAKLVQEGVSEKEADDLRRRLAFIRLGLREALICGPAYVPTAIDEAPQSPGGL
jgi:hypothetical protein